MVVIFYWIRRFSFKFYKNEYNGDFQVADYDFDVKNKNSKWQIQYGGHYWLNLKFFCQIAQKSVSEGFRGRVSRFCNQNSKIENGGLNGAAIVDWIRGFFL